MLVDDFFNEHANYWRDTYGEADIQGIIYQRRQFVALNHIDSLLLPRTAHVLEIGCGAGFLTKALAERGFTIEAIDPSKAMIKSTQNLAAISNLSGKINARIGDTHNLSFADESFDLIVALGVVPWLHDFNKALLEIIRVLRPGGFVVLTMDNAIRATTLLDPSTFPTIEIIIGMIRRKLKKVGLLTNHNPGVDYVPYRRYKPSEFSTILQNSGLKIINRSSIGFGPFTFFGHNLFSEALGVKINLKLQKYADNNWPLLQSVGAQYLVVARKKTSTH